MTPRRLFGAPNGAPPALDERDVELADAIGSLVWDGDDELLRARIHQARESGARVLLPTASRARPPLVASRRRWWPVRLLIGAAGLAACAAIAVHLGDRTGVPVASVGGASLLSAPATSAATGESLTALLNPWPRLAFAQGRAPQPYPPVRVTGTARVRAGQRLYVETVAPRDGAPLVPLDLFEESVQADSLGGGSWLVERRHALSQDREGRRVPTGGFVDSVVVDAATLRPRLRRFSIGDPQADGHTMQIERFSATQYTMEFWQRRAPEELRIVADSNRRGRYLVLREGHALDTTRLFVPYEATLHLLLQAVPLREGWRGSVLVPEASGAIWGRAALRPLNLRVAGVDTVAVFRDRYPAWRVLVENGLRPEVWHVRQRTGEVLAVAQFFPGGTLRSRRYLVGGLAEPDSGRIGGVPTGPAR